MSLPKVILSTAIIAIPLLEISYVILSLPGTYIYAGWSGVVTIAVGSIAPLISTLISPITLRLKLSFEKCSEIYFFVTSRGYRLSQ